MNKLPRHMNTGTIGELLVQIRLLQFGIQAAPPLKDSGNDLIAVRDKVFKAIQVKTRTGDSYEARGFRERRYHILAVVRLCMNGGDVRLDGSQVYLIPKDKVSSAPRRFDELSDYGLTEHTLNDLFRS
jgi:hypothetical protein